MGGNGGICSRMQGLPEEFPHHCVRHALAWQIESAGKLGWAEYQLTTARYTQTIRAFCRRCSWTSP